jgi:hypothetical protein
MLPGGGPVNRIAILHPGLSRGCCMSGNDRLRRYHYRHPGEGRDLTLSVFRTGEIPAFAGMTNKGKPGIDPTLAIPPASSTPRPCHAAPSH